MQKVALVTGASSGIGKATAKLLVKAGFTVYGAARRVDMMQDLQAIGVTLLAMDVTDEASMAAGVNQLLSTENRIDVLVNNAGYGSFGALEDVPLNEAKYQFEVNVFGLARLTQLVLPTMRLQGSGRVINISSMGGKFGEPLGAWYHATKYAVEGLSDCLRMELKQFNIDVVIIEPGAIATEWDGIASYNLLKVSGNTAYGALAKKHVNMFKRTYKFGSQPEVVAKTIVKAATVNHPKARYATGGGAKLILFFRYILPDKWFDAVILANMK
jgi:short-subunit dehydrogenase